MKTLYIIAAIFDDGRGKLCEVVAANDTEAIQAVRREAHNAKKIWIRKKYWDSGKPAVRWLAHGDDGTRASLKRLKLRKKTA